jgi:hypothetical protein
VRAQHPGVTRDWSRPTWNEHRDTLNDRPDARMQHGNSSVAYRSFLSSLSPRARALRPPSRANFAPWGGDGVLLSELDNPRVRTTVPIGHPAWAEFAICSNSGPQSIFYTEDFLVQVATVPTEQGWDVAETLPADNSRSATLCDPTSPDGEYLNGQSVPIETTGIALGKSAATAVTWTKRQTTTPCSPTAQNCLDVASASFRLSDETLLQPIRLVVAFPEGSEPVLSRLEARALFDDYPHENESIVTSALINGQFHVQASQVESGLFPSNIIEGHFRPDAILSQCGVQTRIVGYAAVPIPAPVYEGGAMVSTVDIDTQCMELADGPTNAEINAKILDAATYCPQPLPVDPVSQCPVPGRTSGIHFSALNWIIGTADVMGYQDPVSGGPLPPSTPIANSITVVLSAHTKPRVCGTNLYGFANQKRVMLGHDDIRARSQSTTLTHELFHAMTDSSDHVRPTLLGSFIDQMLMKDGEGTGKGIPGCNRWRTAGSPVPAGCDASLDAQAFAANPNAFGCSMLRNRLGGVVDPPPAGPDIGAMEPPSPPSELVFTYGPDPGAPEVEFTDQTATNGEYSIVVPPGWTEITSPTVLTTSWANVGTEIAVDVYIPETVPNPWWVGAVAFAIDLPGAGFNNAWLGQVDLTPLPRGEWSTVSVQVGQALQEAILGDLPGMRIRIVTNVPDTFGFDPVLLDNLRLGRSPLERSFINQEATAPTYPRRPSSALT